MILTAVAALFVCSPLMAQSHIDKIVEELEQKGVDVSKVVKRDPKTKKPYSIVKSLTFYSKDGNYANRLKEAFRKDAEDAVKEVVERKGNSYQLIFIDGKKTVTYSLDFWERQDKDPRVDLRIIMRDGNVKEFDWFNEWRDNHGGNIFELNGLNGLEDFGNIDWNKYGRELSDKEVEEIVQNMTTSGTSQQAQIVTELLKRGAGMEQIRRLRAQIEAKQKNIEKAKQKAIEKEKKAPGQTLNNSDISQ